MYLVRKACETHGILGKILLIYFNWGRGIFENTTSQIEKTLSHKPLNPEEMTEFVKRSNEIMLLLTK